MSRLVYLLCIVLVGYDQFKSIESASSRSRNNENLVLVTLEKKFSSDSSKISFPNTNEFNENSRFREKTESAEYDNRPNNIIGSDRNKNDEIRWTNERPSSSEDYIERHPNNEKTIWSKTKTDNNFINNNDQMIFERKPTLNINSISLSNKEEILNSDNKEQLSFAENQIAEFRVPAPKKKQPHQKRLCEKKYAEYIRIIFPEDEDTANDADEVDFDGRLLAAPGEYPHMTALGFKTEFGKYDYKCGGSLISEYFVITAAHCANVSGQAPSIARVGDLNLKIEEKYVDPETRSIRKIYVHPDYNDQLYYNDIALIELSSSITFSVDVRPIRLWTRTDAPFPVVFAMGYGSTAFGKALTRQLTYLNLTIVPNDECHKSLPVMPEAPRGIIDSQLCAFDYLMKRDTCQGDSGGPLQYTLKGRRRTTRKHYLLLGIISYGLSCRSNYPSVYTRISTYLDWIEEIVWN